MLVEVDVDVAAIVVVLVLLAPRDVEVLVPSVVEGSAVEVVVAVETVVDVLPPQLTRKRIVAAAMSKRNNILFFIRGIISH